MLKRRRLLYAGAAAPAGPPHVPPGPFCFGGRGVLAERARRLRADMREMRTAISSFVPAAPPASQAEALAAPAQDRGELGRVTVRMHALNELLVRYDERNPEKRRQHIQLDVHANLIGAKLRTLLRGRFPVFAHILHQEFRFRSTKNALLISVPRRHGKTRSASLFAAATMLTHPGDVAVVGAQKKDITKLFIEEVRNHLYDMVGVAEVRRRLVVNNTFELAVTHEGHTEVSKLSCYTAMVSRAPLRPPRPLARATGYHRVPQGTTRRGRHPNRPAAYTCPRGAFPWHTPQTPIPARRPPTPIDDTALAYCPQIADTAHARAAAPAGGVAPGRVRAGAHRHAAAALLLAAARAADQRAHPRPRAKHVGVAPAPPAPPVIKRPMRNVSVY